MNRGIYAPASGMMNNERLLDIVANNLANANTAGYKRDGMSFQEAVIREMSTNGGQGDSIGSIGLGPDTGIQFTSMEQGPITMTSQPLDLAIQGSAGMFAIQTPNGVQYTRDGSFTVSSDGVLVTKDGNPVLDNSFHQIDITPGDISVGPGGSVSIKGATTSTTAGRIGVFTGNFTKLGGNNWLGNGAVADDTIQIQSGAIEGSNVNPIEEMVNLIRIGRTYELQQRSIAQQDELNQKLTTAMN
jgi:flagellar basal-body rod protein FlgG